MPKTKGRSAQRARTRQAILDGARKLLSDGKPVTVAAAAAETGISKATSYRYFSDADLLVAEAVLDIAVKPYDAVISGGPGPARQAQGDLPVLPRSRARERTRVPAVPRRVDARMVRRKQGGRAGRSPRRHVSPCALGT